MQQVLQSLNEDVLNNRGFCSRTRASVIDRYRLSGLLTRVLKRRGVDELPFAPLVPYTAGIDLTVFASTGRIVEELINEDSGRRDLAD
jgi:hypothetical protein